MPKCHECGNVFTESPDTVTEFERPYWERSSKNWKSYPKNLIFGLIVIVSVTIFLVLNILPPDDFGRGFGVGGLVVYTTYWLVLYRNYRFMKPYYEKIHLKDYNE
jgi:hypothetical protein